MIEPLVLEYEYLKAKRTISKYEEQQQSKLQRFDTGDVDLLTVLPPRAKHALMAHNDRKWVEEHNEEIIYISDVVGLIRRTGNIFELLKFRNIGKKSYEDIMHIVRPFL